MLVYMTHPEHGTHIAYTQAEVDHNKKHGWTIREEKKEEEPAKPKIGRPKKVT